MGHSIFSREHKSWEDWAVLALGAALLLSPTTDNAALTPLIVANVVIVGFVVMAVAVSELMLAEHWDARVSFALGVWMIFAPYVIGYSGKMAFWHGVIGGMIAAISAFELWQDFGRTET
jgi:SPW repeat